MSAPRADLTQERLQAARRLQLDRVAVEVIRALGEAEVPALLLKGPTFARWLYDDGTVRPYGDVDLLVPAEGEARAESVLSAAGFIPAPGTGEPDPGVAMNHRWSRDGDVVELHVRLEGARCEPAGFWEAFARDSEPFAVAGAEVQMPSVRARLVHVALHSAQHGVGTPKPQQDLERALARASDPEWTAAAALAQELDALDAFGAGVRMVPDGAALAMRLGVPEPTDPEVLLRARSAPTSALGLDRIAGTPGVWGKLRRIVRVVFPTPSFLRWWTPLARRGRLGLALAYVWRPIWIVKELPRAARAWRRARVRPR